MWPFKRKAKTIPSERDEAFTKFLAEQKKAAAEKDAAFANVVSLNQKLRNPHVELVEGIKRMEELDRTAEAKINLSGAEILGIKNDLKKLNEKTPLPKTGLPQPPINRLSK